MTVGETILPPPSTDYENGRVPYANEWLMLAFEGHHKKFEIDMSPRGERPSYAPPADEDTEDAGLLTKLARLRVRLVR